MPTAHATPSTSSKPKMPSPPRRSPRAPLSLRVQEPHITPRQRNLFEVLRLAVRPSLIAFERDRSQKLRKELRNFTTISIPWLPIPCHPVPYHCHNTTRTPAREAASNLVLWHCGVFSSDPEKKGGGFAKIGKGGPWGRGSPPKHHIATNPANKRLPGRNQNTILRLELANKSQPSAKKKKRPRVSPRPFIGRKPISSPMPSEKRQRQTQCNALANSHRVPCRDSFHHKPMPTRIATPPRFPAV